MSTAPFGDEDPYSKTLGAVSPPYRDPQPPAPWMFSVNKEELREIRTRMIQEFRERYTERSLSELMEIKEYLEKEEQDLRRKGRESWNNARRRRNEIKKGKSNLDTDTEKTLLDQDIEKAGKMHGKADSINYRLNVLKKFLWSICVKGNIPKSQEDLGFKGKTGVWERRKSIMIHINEESGINKYEEWVELAEDILAHEGSDRDPGSVRRQIKRKYNKGELEGEYSNGPAEIAEEVKRWAQNEKLHREAKKYRPPLSAVSGD